MSKPAIQKELMAEFAHLLMNYMGLHYPEEQWHYLEKKLKGAMLAFGISNLEKFLEDLKKGPINREQITLFAQYLTIGETYFFRDSKTFKALKENILPQILKQHQMDQKIRLWCAGCCTGEEPYSLAILLHQILPDWQNWKIQIFGTDINTLFLKKGEIAQYKEWSFRTTPPDIIKTYFVEQSKATYKLIQEIKKKVEFFYLNLAEDSYPSASTGIYDMDLILCHNVLIYFSQSQIKKIVHRLGKSLRKHGWLSVSPIEAPFINDLQLISQECSGAFFFRKEGKGKKEEEVETPSPFFLQRKEPTQEEILLKDLLPTYLQSSSANALPEIPVSKNKEVLDQSQEKPIVHKEIDLHEEKNIFQKCLNLSHHKKYEEAISLLLTSLAPNQSDENFIRLHMDEVILLIQIYANQGEVSFASKWIEAAMRADKLNPILYYLHATILHSLGDMSNGIRNVKRAIFLKPDFAAAYYLLGVFEKHQKNEQSAMRNFKIALELLHNYKEEEILFGTEELTAGYLKDILSNFWRNHDV